MYRNNRFSYTIYNIHFSNNTPTITCYFKIYFYIVYNNILLYLSQTICITFLFLIVELQMTLVLLLLLLFLVQYSRTALQEG